MFIEYLNHCDFHKFRLNTLRTGIMGGTVCPEEIMKRVMTDMHMKEITICYGMTETSCSFQTEADAAIDKRAATVGRVHDHVEVKIVDNNGRVVEVNTPGEICSKGYLVMKGYWGDKKKTDQVLKNGWIYTGDLGSMDDQGYIKIVGRIKDIIIRGGENIYPKEIEDHLYLHPAIQDVQVIGVPDQKFGEAVCAWVILKSGIVQKPTEKDIQDYCAGQIAHYKIPKYVCFVGSFPQTVSGKPQKYIMREETIKMLGLSS